MKRIIALALAVVAGLSLAVAVRTSASAVPAAACRAHTSTQNNRNSWSYSSTLQYHYTQRLYTTPNCEQIYIRSEGWRFNFYGCGDMWVRRYNSDGTSYVVEGSRREVCGGNTVMLISRIAGNRPFRVEARSHSPGERNSMHWPIGAVLY